MKNPSEIQKDAQSLKDRHPSYWNTPTPSLCPSLGMAPALLWIALGESQQVPLPSWALIWFSISSVAAAESCPSFGAALPLISSPQLCFSCASWYEELVSQQENTHQSSLVSAWVHPIIAGILNSDNYLELQKTGLPNHTAASNN